MFNLELFNWSEREKLSGDAVSYFLQSVDKHWTWTKIGQRLWNCLSWQFFIGQCLDKCWISMSNLCPRVSELDRYSTDFGQILYFIGQTLYFFWDWTDIGQGLDRHWTEIGFCVQSPSNQPRLRSTDNLELNQEREEDKREACPTDRFTLKYDTSRNDWRRNNDCFMLKLWIYVIKH